MQRNYWQEYWDNYYKFMAVYLDGMKRTYDDVDIKKEYLEVSRLFEPPMTPEGHKNYNRQDNNNQQANNTNSSQPNSNQQTNNTGDMSTNDALSTELFMFPGGGQLPGGFMQPGMNQGPDPVMPAGQGQGPGPVIPPGLSQGPGPAIPTPGGAAPFMQPGAGMSPGQGAGSQPFISPGGGQFTINNCRRMAVVRVEMRRGFNPSSFFMIVDSTDRRSIQGFRIACDNNRIRFVPMAIEYRNINVIECVF